jgi:hypothetical protein
MNNKTKIFLLVHGIKAWPTGDSSQSFSLSKELVEKIRRKLRGKKTPTEFDESFFSSPFPFFFTSLFGS